MKRSVSFVVTFLLIVGVVVAATLWPVTSRSWPLNDWRATASSRPSDMTLAFGLSRESKTTSVLQNVCSRGRAAAARAPRVAVQQRTQQGRHPGKGNKNQGRSRQRRAAFGGFTTLVENSRGRCVHQQHRKKPYSVTERPAIMATTVLRDLAPCDRDGATDGHVDQTGSFPADQITATSELVASTGLRVVVVADPLSPTEVEPGTYCGQIVVQRDRAPYRTVNIAITLADRGGSALAWAILWLFVGALIGVVIRFLNDPISKLISPYRRLRALRRWVRRLPASLDTEGKLTGQLQDIEEAIKFLDVEAAEAILLQMEQIRTETNEEKLKAAVAEVRSAATEGVTTIDLSGSGLNGPLVRLFNWYWLLALIVVIAGVVAVGLVTRYVENTAFAGTQRDWVGLVVFGLAAQVTATAVSESLGRLLPTTR